MTVPLRVIPRARTTYSFSFTHELQQGSMVFAAVKEGGGMVLGYTFTMARGLEPLMSGKVPEAGGRQTEFMEACFF